MRHRRRRPMRLCSQPTLMPSHQAPKQMRRLHEDMHAKQKRPLTKLFWKPSTPDTDSTQLITKRVMLLHGRTRTHTPSHLTQKTVMDNALLTLFSYVYNTQCMPCIRRALACLYIYIYVQAPNTCLADRQINITISRWPRVRGSAILNLRLVFDGATGGS